MARSVCAQNTVCTEKKIIADNTIGGVFFTPADLRCRANTQKHIEVPQLHSTELLNVCRADLFTSENDQTFDDIAEFADVSRPTAQLQGL
jgi:hypothetical protein